MLTQCKMTDPDRNKSNEHSLSIAGTGRGLIVTRNNQRLANKEESWIVMDNGVLLIKQERTYSYRSSC